jgi:hypothetical protein
MKNKFDVLISNPASALTRRAALKRFSFGAASLALARFGLNEAQAIVNGTLDGNAHTSVGGVVWLVSPWPNAQPPVVCGSGTLIHPRVYLTAGHGTYLIQSIIAQGQMTLNDLLVSFSPNASDPPTWLPVSGILTHPGFAPNASSSEDVGVLILKQNVSAIPAIPLPPAGFLDALAASGQLQANQTKFTVVGYGIDPGNANNGHLPFPPDGLRRSAQTEFQNLHDRWVYEDQNDSHDNGGSCTCDSGGPLFYVDPVTGLETLVAVVSRGTLTNVHDYRVDTTVALSFINDVITRVNNGEL